MERRYLSIKELSEYLGLTTKTLYVWVCHKKIPYFKLGRLVKFDLREIEDWMAKKKIEEIS